MVFAYLRSRMGQWLSGALGYALVASGIIGSLVIGYNEFKDNLTDAAVAARDLKWEQRLATASNNARDASAARQRAIEQAAAAERAKNAAEQTADVIGARVRDLETQLRTYKSAKPNICGYTPKITRSLRK